MKPASLILSQHRDLNMLSAHWGLQANGVHALSAPSIADVGFWPWSITASSDVWSTHARFSEFDVRSVWCHRPRAPKIEAGVLAEDIECVETEWLLLQKNIFALSWRAIAALWINDYASAVNAENKLVQLRIARELGIGFPETLVSNDPAKVRQFLQRHGRIIYKHFSPHGWIDPLTGRCYSSVVTTLDSLDAVDDASIAMCPGIYQPYVDKVCDLRVTMIGDRFFPVRIASNRGDAFVDWRPRTNMPDLLAESCELPSSYVAKLASLMKELGIVYGCIDLAADAHGNLHFFEVNQTGQYLFVEEWLPELPLLKAMCAMLAQGRVDYSLNDAADISLVEFQQSESYDGWLNEQRAAVAELSFEARSTKLAERPP